MNEGWTIPALLERWAERRADADFLVHGGEHITYAEMAVRVECLAAGLRSVGIEANTPVALMLDNEPVYVECWFALARLGAVEVPLNPEQRGATLEHMVRLAAARTLICTPGHLEEIARSTPAALVVFEKIVLVGERRDIDMAPAVRVHPLAELREVGGDAGPRPRPDAILGVMYTSGTTGPSKGVLVSQHYHAFVGDGLAAMAGLGADDVMYACLPLFHQGAQADCVMTMLAVGGAVAITDRFSAGRWWEEVDRYGATTFIGFAAMLSILHKCPPSTDDAANPVRVGIVGHVLSKMQRDFEARFGLRLLNVYGMTETENAIFPRDPDSTPVGSMGVADTENFDVALLDVDDEPVPRGSTGEICLRPRRPHIMMEGYHEMPEATLRACRNLWFHTGDLARQDEDGHFFFVDRLKDSIRRRGENVSSSEVEEVLNQHPGVAESAVFAVPSELGEDEIAAHVVPRSADLSEEDLIRFAAERMAYFMIPRYVALVDDLPRTQTNKISKQRLKEIGVAAGTWDRERTDLKSIGRRAASASGGAS